MASSCRWVWFQPPSTLQPSIAPTARPTGTPSSGHPPAIKQLLQHYREVHQECSHRCSCCHELFEPSMNIQTLRACEQKDLNGTGFQPFRSNYSRVLACLECRGHIPLGTHRESTLNLWSIPADMSFQRRAALQPTMKVAEPLEQRSSFSQQHRDNLRILHRKMFVIKPE